MHQCTAATACRSGHDRLQCTGFLVTACRSEHDSRHAPVQVPQGVHASLSGIPWWTTDVGVRRLPLCPHLSLLLATACRSAPTSLCSWPPSASARLALRAAACLSVLTMCTAALATAQGYGCGSEQPNNTPYMKELIVRCERRRVCAAVPCSARLWCFRRDSQCLAARRSPASVCSCGCGAAASPLQGTSLVRGTGHPPRSFLLLAWLLC